MVFLIPIYVCEGLSLTIIHREVQSNSSITATEDNEIAGSQITNTGGLFKISKEAKDNTHYLNFKIHFLLKAPFKFPLLSI